MNLVGGKDRRRAEPRASRERGEKRKCEEGRPTWELRGSCLLVDSYRAPPAFTRQEQATKTS
eukprot:3606614-Rhodomonas_salina.1